MMGEHRHNRTTNPELGLSENRLMPRSASAGRMRKTLHTDGHAAVIALLKGRRLRAGLTQQQVADKLGVPQSFVAKYEGGERRLDVLEFIEAAQALGAEPRKLFAAVLRAVEQTRANTP